MQFNLSIPFSYLVYADGVLSLVGCLLGVITTIAPGAIIKLHQWIMRLCNWSVTPLEPQRELRNTRFLGIVLTVLSGFLLVWSVILYKSLGCPLMIVIK